MRKLVMSLLAVLAVLALSACSRAATESDEYLELEAEVAALTAERDSLEEQQSEVTKLIATLAASDEPIAAAQAEIEALEDEKQGLGSEVAQAKDDLGDESEQNVTLGDQRDALIEDVAAAVLDAPGFETAVESYVADLDRSKCALDIRGVLAGLGGSRINANDLAPTQSDSLLEMGMKVFGVSEPSGCPDWWIGEDTDYWSSSAILSALCETIDVDRLSRRPEEYEGSCVTGWGSIVQFDYNTGPCAMHINIGPRNTAWYNYDLRVELKDASNDCAWLDAIGQDDEIEWWAIGDGVISYSTTAGGMNTIPTLNIITFRD